MKKETELVAHYIGADPIKWLDRLIEVNEQSAFPVAQKNCIAAYLKQLQERLQKAPFDEHGNI